MARIAIIAALCLAGSPSTKTDEPVKPPSCAPGTKGVMWDFGTEAQPDVRRCDGVSYVPYNLVCKAPASASSSSSTTNDALKRNCQETCESQRLSCQAGCHGIMQSSCKEDCTAAKARCATRC